METFKVIKMKSIFRMCALESRVTLWQQQIAIVCNFQFIEPKKKSFHKRRGSLKHIIYTSTFFSCRSAFCVEAKNAVSPIKSMLSNGFYFNFEILVLDSNFNKYSSFPTLCADFSLIMI